MSYIMIIFERMESSDNSNVLGDLIDLGVYPPRVRITFDRYGDGRGIIGDHSKKV